MVYRWFIDGYGFCRFLLMDIEEMFVSVKHDSLYLAPLSSINMIVNCKHVYDLIDLQMRAKINLCTLCVCVRFKFGIFTIAFFIAKRGEFTHQK